MPWLCKLPIEANRHFGPFWYTCWRNFGTLSVIRLNFHDLTLKVKSQVIGHGCVSCSGRLCISTISYIWDHFGTMSRTSFLDLEFGALKVKCQVRGHGCVSCPERLVVTWDYFDTPSDVIAGRPSVRRPFTLKLIFNMALKNKMNAIFVLCVLNLTLARIL